MGATAARKAREIVRNTSRVLAIELISAAQAIDLMDQRPMGSGTRALYRDLRSHVRPLEEDRPLSKDIEKVAGLILSGDLEGL